MRSSYRIPKRIIQTGKTADQPLHNRATMSSIRMHNPGYEYLFFDDEAVERFIDQEYPRYRPVFNSFRRPIQRYDFFRYLAIYHYGGFYFDLDVLLASGLSSLLDCGCVFPFEGLTYSHLLRAHHRMDWQIGNYAFGAVPGHPFLEVIIRNCLRAQTDTDWVRPMMRGTPPLQREDFFVLNATGPGLISRTLAENPGLARSVTVLFPEDVCDLRCWNRFGNFGIHLMQGSWRSERRSCWMAWLVNRLEHRTMKRCMKQSLQFGRTREYPLVGDRLSTCESL